MDKFIKSNIIKLFPKLNDFDVEWMREKLIRLISIIQAKYGYNDNDMIDLFTSVNMEKRQSFFYIEMFILLILPYIEDVTMPYIESLSDIYVKKDDNGNYKFSNIQYNRCIRGENITDYKEREFSYEYIEQQCILLEETIKRIIYKLYVNWTYIYPVINYKKTKLYADTLINIKEKKYDMDTGIYIGDYYDLIVHYLYLHVKKIKWLLFEYENNASIVYKSFEKIYDDDEKLTSFINNTYNQRFVKGLGIAFKNYMAKTEEADNEISDDEEGENEEDPIEYLKRSKIKDIKDYLDKSINKLKNTIYWDYINTNDDTTSYWFYDNVTLKNMYNFGKSLCHYIHKEKWTQLPIYWCSLSIEQREIILQRIHNNRFNKGDTIWFNIRSNIKKTWPYKTKQEIALLNDAVYQTILGNYCDLIFTILHKRGFLSEIKLKPEYHITGNDSNTDIIRKKIEARLKYKDTYYYIKGEKYSEEYLINLSKLTNNELNSLTWVKQIDFYHKYMNLRCLFVTGGTGSGKTSTTPFLLYYGEKMINHNEAPNIVWTVPRISIVTATANRMSSQVGFPLNFKDDTAYEDISDEIEKQLKKKEDNKLKNYIIQYRFSGQRHESSDFNYGVIKFTTDGSLVNEMLMEDYVPPTIIAIDESHEHGYNMDAILTIARNIIYWHNETKIVIISATMLNDEPIYRRYYRDINDNLLYPINQFLMFNKLDRINIDRRLHLSPPNIPTPHKVYEIYTQDNNNDTYENNERIGKEIIYDLCRKGLNGNILMFSIGTNEIKKLLVEFNTTYKIPSYIIALPLYKDLPSSWRDELTGGTGLRDFIKQLTIKKENILDAIEHEFKQTYEVQQGTYRYAIIIGTTIVEASLTIDPLSYVIETGFSKSNSYDIVRNIYIDKLSPISESSRIQRKGRVGRVGSGLVYYTYKQYSRLNNNPELKFCLENITLLIYKLINSNKNLIDIKSDPNYYDNYINGYADPSSKVYPLLNILINRQYKTNGKLLYYGNDDMYDYNNMRTLGLITELTVDIISDTHGKFYIIHPSEYDIIRDKLSGLIINEYHNRVELYLQKLVIKSFLVKIDELTYTKTLFGQNAALLIGELGIEMTLSYVYGRLMGCENDIIDIISFIDARINLYQLLSKSKLIPDKYSDLYTILNFTKILHQLHLTDDFYTKFTNLYFTNKNSLPDTLIEYFDNNRRKIFWEDFKKTFNRKFVDILLRTDLFDDVFRQYNIPKIKVLQFLKARINVISTFLPIEKKKKDDYNKIYKWMANNVHIVKDIVDGSITNTNTILAFIFGFGSEYYFNKNDLSDSIQFDSHIKYIGNNLIALSRTETKYSYISNLPDNNAIIFPSVMLSKKNEKIKDKKSKDIKKVISKDKIKT